MADRLQVVFWLAPNFAAHPFHDLSAYVLNLDVGMITPVPKYLLSWKAMLFPYTWLSWLLIFSSFVVAVPIFTVDYSKNMNMATEARMMAVKLAARILLQCPMEPLPKTGKPLIILFFYYGLPLSATINTLCAFLTIRQREPVPRTLKDLVSEAGRSCDVNYIHLRGTVNEAFFMSSKDTVVAEVSRSMRRIPALLPLAIEAATDILVNRRSIINIDYSHVSALYLAQNLTLNRKVPPARVSPRILTVGG